MTVYCLNLHQQVIATIDHLGRVTCRCGERIEPVVIRTHRTKTA